MKIYSYNNYGVHGCLHVPIVFVTVMVGGTLVTFCMWLSHNFFKELTSTTQQKTVHITPNRAEFLKAMITHHGDDYEVFMNNLCLHPCHPPAYRRCQGIKVTFTS